MHALPGIVEDLTCLLIGWNPTQHRSLLIRLDNTQKLGLSASDLRTTLAWLLAGAPTIIHLKLKTVLGSLVADTHYRNQFE